MISAENDKPVKIFDKNLVGVRSLFFLKKEGAGHWSTVTRRRMHGPNALSKVARTCQPYQASPHVASAPSPAPRWPYRGGENRGGAAASRSARRI